MSAIINRVIEDLKGGGQVQRSHTGPYAYGMYPETLLDLFDVAPAHQQVVSDIAQAVAAVFMVGLGKPEIAPAAGQQIGTTVSALGKAAHFDEFPALLARQLHAPSAEGVGNISKAYLARTYERLAEFAKSNGMEFVASVPAKVGQVASDVASAVPPVAKAVATKVGKVPNPNTILNWLGTGGVLGVLGKAVYDVTQNDALEEKFLEAADHMSADYVRAIMSEFIEVGPTEGAVPGVRAAELISAIPDAYTTEDVMAKVAPYILQGPAVPYAGVQELDQYVTELVPPKLAAPVTETALPPQGAAPESGGPKPGVEVNVNTPSIPSLKGGGGSGGPHAVPEVPDECFTLIKKALEEGKGKSGVPLACQPLYAWAQRHKANGPQVEAILGGKHGKRSGKSQPVAIGAKRVHARPQQPS
jgi:hypothetical protein